MPRSRRTRLLVAASLVFAAASPARGHEKHPASSSTRGGAPPAAGEGSSELFEALARVEGGRLTLFLSDARTNAPIASARVAVVLPELSFERLAPADPKRPGAYALELPPEPASKRTAAGPATRRDTAAVLAVETGSVRDLLAIDGLVLDTGEGASAPAAPSRKGDATAAARLSVSKDVQHLLPIRTEVVRAAAAAGARVFAARLVPLPAAKAEVIAPVLGRVSAPGDRLPAVGDRVKKGDTLLVLEHGVPPSETGLTTALASPIDGVVTRANVTLGERVPAGRAFFTILDPRAFHASAELYEKDLLSGEFLRGARAEVSLRSDPSRRYAARFVAVSYTVDPATATASASYEVENRDGVLREGMLVDLRLSSAGGARALSVPGRAVVSRDGKDVVFVKTAAEEFEARAVALAGWDGERARVASGLSAGEHVVVEGATHLLSELRRGATLRGR